MGIEIRIAHFPPYCSKFNPIEHRLFPHVTRALQGVVLESVEIAKQFMERTSTRTGLKVTVRCLKKVFLTGRNARRSSGSRCGLCLMRCCRNGITWRCPHRVEIGKLFSPRSLAPRNLRSEDGPSSLPTPNLSGSDFRCSSGLHSRRRLYRNEKIMNHTVLSASVTIVLKAHT